MQRLASAVTGRRGRWVVIGLWMLVTFALAPLAAKLPDRTDDRFMKLIPDASQSAEVGRMLEKRFPQGETAPALLVYTRAGGLTVTDQERIVDDAREAAEVPLALRPLAPFGPGAQQRFVSRDGDVAFTFVPLQAAKQEEVTESVEELRGVTGTGEVERGLSVHVTGAAPIESDLQTAIESADAKLLIATGSLVLLLLIAIYRSPVVALIPLVAVVVAYQAAAGIIFVFADAGMHVTNTARSLLLVLMFGAATDYCLLLVARYTEELRSRENAADAMRAALPRALPAIVASGLTVIAALLVLLVSDLRLNQTFGPTNAVGIAVGMIAALTLVPALLAVVGRRGFWPGSTRVAYRSPAAEASPGPPATGAARSGWERVGRAVLRRPVVALAAVVGILGIGIVGLTNYQAENNIVDAFREEVDSTRGFRALQKGFPPGALAPNTVLVERADGPIRPQDVQAVVERLRTVPDVGDISEPAGRSEDGRVVSLVMTFPDDPYANPALDRIKAARAALDADLPDGVRAIIGDGAAVQEDYRASAQRDLTVVVPLVLLVIFLILCALLRALVAPLYLVASVVLSFFAILGTCVVVFEVFLSDDAVSPTFPTLAFVFLVALGVDYNIFLMDRVREEARLHGTREGMLRGLVATGPVITSAGIILAGTFAVLATLPVTILVHLGIAVSLGVLVDTFLVRTILVPAIAALAGDRSWWPSKLPPRSRPGGEAVEADGEPERLAVV